MKNLVVFDVDGVLADFEDALVERLFTEFGEDAKANRDVFSLEERYTDHPEILKRALQYTNFPLFYRELEPIEDAIVIQKHLMDAGYPIMYVSSRPKYTDVFTRLWLQKHTYNYSKSLGLFCDIKDKADFLSEITVEFVVDDSPYQIEKFKEKGIPYFCWSQPWNDGIFPRLVTDRNNFVYVWVDERNDEVPFIEFLIDMSVESLR